MCGGARGFLRAGDVTPFAQPIHLSLNYLLSLSLLSLSFCLSLPVSLPLPLSLSLSIIDLHRAVSLTTSQSPNLSTPQPLFPAVCVTRPCHLRAHSCHTLVLSQPIAGAQGSALMVHAHVHKPDVLRPVWHHALRHFPPGQAVHRWVRFWRHISHFPMLVVKWVAVYAILFWSLPVSV